MNENKASPYKTSKKTNVIPLEIKLLDLGADETSSLERRIHITLFFSFWYLVFFFCGIIDAPTAKASWELYPQA